MKLIFDLLINIILKLKIMQLSNNPHICFLLNHEYKKLNYPYNFEHFCTNILENSSLLSLKQGDLLQNHELYVYMILKG